MGVSLFISLYVNNYFQSTGLCDNDPHLPPSEINAKCRRAYVLAAELSGVSQLVALICAPLFGYLDGRFRRFNAPLLLAASTCSAAPKHKATPEIPRGATKREIQLGDKSAKELEANPKIKLLDGEKDPKAKALLDKLNDMARELGAAKTSAYAYPHPDWRLYYFLAILVFYLLMTWGSERILDRLRRRLSAGQATMAGEAMRKAAQ